jgi:hypothetical protein
VPPELYVVFVPPIAEAGGTIFPVPPPVLVHIFAPAVAPVHTYCSPDVEFTQRCPTADGLDDTVGSDAETVVSVSDANVEVNPVRFPPSIAGNAPVRFADVKPVKLAPEIAGNAPVNLVASIVVAVNAPVVLILPRSTPFVWNFIVDVPPSEFNTKSSELLFISLMV